MAWLQDPEDLISLEQVMWNKFEPGSPCVVISTTNMTHIVQHTLVNTSFEGRIMRITKYCTTTLSLTASHVGYVWLCLWESWGYGYTYSREMVLKMPRTTLDESKISWIITPFVCCKISARWCVSKSLKHFYRSTDSSWLIQPQICPPFMDFKADSGLLPFILPSRIHPPPRCERLPPTSRTL